MTCNPFLDTLPPMMTKDDLFAQIQYFPEHTNPRTSTDRCTQITELAKLFLPMDYMYYLYDIVYRAIYSTYSTMDMTQTAMQLNALNTNTVYGTKQRYAQAFCGSVLGVPGIGKTSGLKRILRTFPQCVEHESYEGKPFYCRQINYLFVECPSDCSVKTLGFNIAYAVDCALGSNYLELIQSAKYRSASAIIVFIKQICLNHHVGLIVIDEIQNAVQTASMNKQSGNLIKFLVELMNDTCTAILLVGTPEAEQLFSREEHLRRRTRGPRLLPMDYDETFQMFLSILWQYSYTAKKSVLDEKIAACIHQLSGGIPAHIVQLYQSVQTQAILDGSEKITVKELQSTAKTMAFSIPAYYSDGVPISRFRMQQPETEQDEADEKDALGKILTKEKPARQSKLADEKEPESKQMEGKKTRGRKPKARSEKDILVLCEEDDRIANLKKAGLLEEVNL